jgi:hypothetical protein
VSSARSFGVGRYDSKVYLDPAYFGSQADLGASGEEGDEAGVVEVAVPVAAPVGAGGGGKGKGKGKGKKKKQ